MTSISICPQLQLHLAAEKTPAKIQAAVAGAV